MYINLFFNQFVCYVIELLPALCCGLQLSYGGIAVPAHQEEDAKIHLDLEMGSWFGTTFR